MKISKVDKYLLDLPGWYRNNGYIVKTNHNSGNRSCTLLHRLILETKLNRKLKSSEYVDHINGDRSDNRRSNLRIATYKQSAQNKSIQTNNKLGYKGVAIVSTKHLKTPRYRAQIGVNGKQIYLGSFNSAIEAAKAYDTAALHYFGKFARLNFMKGMTK